MFERAWNQLNGVDVLVNGAGMNQQKVPVEKIEVLDWDAHMALNLRAPMVLCREAMMRMSEGSHLECSEYNCTDCNRIIRSMRPKYGLLGFTNTCGKRLSHEESR